MQKKTLSVRKIWIFNAKQLCWSFFLCFLWFCQFNKKNNCNSATPKQLVLGIYQFDIISTFSLLKLISEVYFQSPGLPIPKSPIRT